MKNIELHTALDNYYALDFMLGGNSTCTLRSKKTGARYTYKIKKPKTQKVKETYFVSLLTRPDNENGYEYIGYIQDGTFFHGGKKARVQESAPSVLALSWSLRVLVSNDNAMQNLEVWHSGKCGCCGRTLTVPESVSVGIGPECRKRIGYGD